MMNYFFCSLALLICSSQLHAQELYKVDDGMIMGFMSQSPTWLVLYNLHYHELQVYHKPTTTVSTVRLKRGRGPGEIAQFASNMTMLNEDEVILTDIFNQ